jgi:hypothetical protein
MIDDLGIAESVVGFLEDNRVFEDDTIARISELPFDYDQVLSIIYSPSPRPNEAIDVYRQTLDFWVRFSNSKAGYNKLVQVLDLLHKRTNYKLDGFHVYFSLAQGMINDMGKDEERRQLYKVSIDFMYRRDLALS